MQREIAPIAGASTWLPGYFAGSEGLLLRHGDGYLAFDAVSTLIYEVPATAVAHVRRTLHDSRTIERSAAEHEALAARMQSELHDRPITNIALTVAEACNLGCGYCYAQGGSFGRDAKRMRADVARTAIEKLMSALPAGTRTSIAFMGGEPLVNRDVIHDATAFAVSLAAERQLEVRFAITTNGTLLTDADAELFARHGFGVTVSVDGPRAVHDKLRPFRNGRGSFDSILARLEPLVSRKDRLELTARVTVGRRNLDLRHTIAELRQAGFDRVGFSPLVSSYASDDALREEDFVVLLEEMIACGMECERALRRGDPHPFVNLQSALEEIHSGKRRALPCGAGASYLAVDNAGELTACHRFVGDSAAVFGSLTDWVDDAARVKWIQTRHVDRQEPCRSCWARYLCSGGCHFEVSKVGRQQCEYIRGWLAYCIGAYARVSQARQARVEPAHDVQPQLADA